MPPPRDLPAPLGLLGDPAPAAGRPALSPVPGRSPIGEIALRNQLSGLQSLLALSMVMTETGDQGRILQLASSTVSSLAHSRFEGAYLLGDGWQAVAGPCMQPRVRASVQSQMGELGAAGGLVTVPGEAWGWAFPLRSVEGHFGYLVIGADTVPLDSEHFLLRVLAQQTGIALANARLHARERSTAEELQASNAQLQRSMAIHDRLTQVAVRAQGYEGIAHALHDVTDYQVAVEDRHGNLLAWAGPERPDPYPKDPSARRSAFIESLQQRHSGATRVGNRLVVAVSLHDDVLAVIGLVDPFGRAGDQDRIALEQGATVLAVELARLQSMLETELRLGRDLVEELLAGTDDERALLRAQLLGYELGRPHRVVVVGCNDGSAEEEELFHAVRRGARTAGVGPLLTVRRGTVVLLAGAADPWERLRSAVEAELHHGRCSIGVGGICEGAADFPRSYREAQLALRLQQSIGAGAGVTPFDELGVFQVIAEAEDPATIHRFVRRWIGPLLDYDASKSTDLVLTLSRYLESGRSYDVTARALAVHRNTLRYRLRRIREILGVHPADPDVQFNLQLATRAWQTLDAIHDSAATGEDFGQ